MTHIYYFWKHFTQSHCNIDFSVKPQSGRIAMLRTHRSHCVAPQFRKQNANFPVHFVVLWSDQNLYRPQWSCRKVMFLHLSVILSTGGVCHTPRADIPPGQTSPCAVHAGIRSTSGRYASYWNAFFFRFIFRPNWEGRSNFIALTKPITASLTKHSDIHLPRQITYNLLCYLSV